MATPCPTCGSEKSKVKQTLHKEGYTEREKECSACGARFLTAEAVIKAIERS